MPWDLTVDLGADTTFDRVSLFQGAVSEYAPSYQIQVATAAAPSTWTTVRTITGSTGSSAGAEQIAFPVTTARYVRWHATSQVGAYAPAVFEFGVYSDPPPINLALGRTASMNTTPYSGYGASKAIDGVSAAYAQANTLTPWDLTVDLGQNQLINEVHLLQGYGSEYAGSYEIQVATAAAPTTWTTVYSTSSSAGSVGGTPEIISFSSVSARYVNVNAISTVGSYAWALFEFGVFAR